MYDSKNAVGKRVSNFKFNKFFFKNSVKLDGDPFQIGSRNETFRAHQSAVIFSKKKGRRVPVVEKLSAPPLPIPLDQWRGGKLDAFLKYSKSVG